MNLINRVSKEANEGYNNAQCFVAYLYEEGVKIRRDYRKFRFWYKKAAKQDKRALYWFEKAIPGLYFLSVQKILGIYYHKGWGVKKDCKQSVKKYRKAIKNGSAWAKYCLGLCYQTGEGVEKNSRLAQKWFEAAAKEAVKEAKLKKE